MPPAGLEPAALCLASSIRLSLTARQSWGCWLDYILDVSVPTRIVSEDPSRKSAQVSCGLPNPRGLLLGPLTDRSTGGSQGVPAYRVVHSMGSDRIPHQGSNKADALSAELQGHIQSSGMLARQRPMSTTLKAAPKQTKRDRPWGRPL
jgi:hypothetical protein